jgi:hypothetical protein
MIDHNTRRVFLSFIIIEFLIFGSCSRKVTSDISEGATVTFILAIFFIIIKSIILFYCFSHVVLVLGRSQVISLREAIVTVAEENILDDI